MGILRVNILICFKILVFISKMTIYVILMNLHRNSPVRGYKFKVKTESLKKEVKSSRKLDYIQRSLFGTINTYSISILSIITVFLLYDTFINKLYLKNKIRKIIKW